MTAAVGSPPPAAGVAAATAESSASAQRPRRRWPRIVIPLGVVVVFWIITVAAHAYQEPDLADHGTLSPLGTGRHGSSQLVELLRGQDVAIERVTSTTAAIEAARGRDATILVPTPDLLDGQLVPELIGAPGEHRVVMLKAGLFGRFFSGLDANVESSRWASETVEPACPLEEAQRAGAALVHRDRYTGVGLTTRCYGGSLVGGQVGDVEVLLLGATDPFRNDRIAEAGNAVLATGLLGRYALVIWVDVHASEARRPAQQPPPDFEREDQDRTRTGNPLLDAFPVQLWTVFVLLVGAAAMLAVARARRLGPPVPEPLPVVVPAAEAVTGRGRLYRRIDARGSSLTTLRAGALARLARAVDPLARSPERGLIDPGPRRDAFIRAIATRSGLPEATIAAVLFGPLPADDGALVAAAADLDRLAAAVLGPPRANPAPRRSPGGSP